jgi:hypothetical protein
MLHEGSGTGGHALHIWNNNTASWEKVASTNISVPDQVLTAIITSDFSNYIEGGYLQLLAIANKDTSGTIYTDYVKVDVTIPIESDFNFRQPTIDGVFSHAEWTNPQLLIETPIPTSVYFANDRDFLYILVDAANAAGGDYTEGEGDHCLLMFDTNNDEVISKGHEDLFIIYGNGYKWHAVAAQDGIVSWIEHCNFDSHVGLEGVVGFGDSPNSPINHRIYEFQIPLSLLGASPGDTIGFVSAGQPASIPFDVDTSRHNIWPPNATVTDMATWGDLVLASSSTAPVPTMGQWGMIGMGILLAVALVWSVRRRWVVSADKS